MLHIFDRRRRDTSGAGRRSRRLRPGVAGLEARALLSGPDTTAPTTQAVVLAGVVGTNSFYKSPVTVGLTAADPDNDPSTLKTYVSLDGASYVAENSLTIGDGTHAIQFFSVDPAGNAGPLQSQTYQVDTEAPSVQSAVFYGVPGANGYYKSPVTLGLSANDPDNPAYTLTTFARIDDGPYVPTNIVPIYDGTHTVQFFAVDPAGNMSGVVTQTYKVDTTAPTAQATVLAGIPGANGYYKSPVTLGLSANDPDNASGTLTTFARVDGGAFVATNTVRIGDGIHTVQFYAVDQAGNAGPVVTQTYKVDTTAPTVTAAANVTTLWPPNNKYVPVTVTGHVSDASGGVPTAVFYQVYDSYGQVQPGGMALVNAQGNYSFTVNLLASRNGSDKAGRLYGISVVAIDEAGNAGSAAVFVSVPHDQGKKNGDGNGDGNGHGGGND